MNNWIRSQKGILFNLNRFSYFTVKKFSDDHSVCGFAPGIAVDSADEERFDMTYIFSGTEAECKAVLDQIAGLVQAVDVTAKS